MAIYELEDRVYFDGAMPGDIAEAEDTSAEETENTANTSDIDSSNTDSVENVSIAPETGTAQDSSGDAENENGSGDDSDITGNGNGTDVSYLPDNDIDSVFAAIDDITLPDDFQPERNILIASSDYDRIDEITASVNDNTILITYDSNDTFDSIIQKLKDELGDTKALNIGIVDSDISEQLKVNSEQCDDFLDQLSGLKYYDGKINLIEITSGSPLNEDAAVSSDFTSLTLSADNNGDWTFSENADTELLPDYFGSDTSLLAANGDQLATDNEIYFIDYNVDDIDQILSEIPEDAIIIELAEGEGLDKITETVNLYHNIDAVHIISQANHAQILLGTDVITADNISEYQEAFSSWSDNLSSNADILFYGCNIAKEANGQSVLNHIAEWTGADIAASTDVTGGILAADSNQPAADIADWDMEFNIGNIEASALSVEAYRHHLATYTVTEITDNGTGTVEGSLSWAVEQSNLTTTVDDNIVFNLDSGDTVTISAQVPEITDAVEIDGTNLATGNNVTVTVIDQSTSHYRVFKIDALSQIITIKNMTIKGGDISDLSNFDDDGGGIYAYRADIIYLENLTITGSRAGIGAGVAFSSAVDEVYITSCTVSGNNTTKLSGGAIYSVTDNLTITSTLISGNIGEDGNGGITFYGKNLVLSSTTITDNISYASMGGGVEISGTQSESLTMTDCVISNNTSKIAGGGVYIGEGVTATMTNCTVSGNSLTGSSSGTGGGIAVLDEGYLYMTNCTVFDNSAQQVGGIALWDVHAYAYLDSCTIANNTSSTDNYNYAGGIYLLGGNITVKNTIIANNTANGHGSDFSGHASNPGVLVDNGYNVVKVQTGDYFSDSTDILYSGGSWTRNGSALANQTMGLAGALTYNGGYGMTLAISGSGFLATEAGSTASATDQRGYYRSGTETIGAYQYNASVAKIGTGTSWTSVTDTFTSIQDAIDAVSSSGQTIVLAGTEINVSESVEIGTSSVAYSYNVTIQGETDDTVVRVTSPGSSSYRTLYINAGGTVNINDMTIKGGNLSATHGLGGGMYINGGTVNLENVIVSNSIAETGGGIYLCDSTVLEMTDCTLTENASTRHGGGIFAALSTLTMNNCTISNNSSTLSGGGINNSSSTVTLINCTISENSAGTDGGGIDTTGNLTCTNCTVKWNTAAVAGGIHIDHTNAELTNCTVTVNTATDDGGGIYIKSYSTVTVNNSTVSNNTASGTGGGIYCSTSSVFETVISVLNSTITGNTASENGGGFAIISSASNAVNIRNSTIAYNYADDTGGGLYIDGEEVNIQNCTIAYNHSDNDVTSGLSRGGGIYLNSGSLTVQNTILYNNYRGSGTIGTDDYYYSGGTLTDGGYNIIRKQNTLTSNRFLAQGSYDITFNGINWLQYGETTATLSGSLNLSSILADNGGVTQTLAITANSVATNGAPTASSDFNGAFAIDQRGYYRTDASSGTRTIGAYQYNGTAPANNDYISNYETTGNWSESSTWLKYSTTNEYWAEAAAPTSSNTNKITIDSGSNVTVDTDASGKTLRIGYGATLTVSPTYSVTVTTSLNALGGNITYSGAGILYLNSASADLGNFTPGASTVVYNSTGIQTLSSGSYYNLTVSNGSTKTLGSNIDIDGDLVISSGTTLDTSASNYSVNLAGDLTNSGTFTVNSSSVTFDGGGIQNITGSAVTFSGLSLSTGTVLTTSQNITITGSTSGTGTVNASGGTFTYNASSGQSIFGGTYNSLTLSDTSSGLLGSSSKTLTGNLDINGNFSIGEGAVLDTSANNYDVDIEGKLLNNGTITANSSSISIAGEFENNGTFTAGSSTVIFDSGGTQSLIGNKSISFYGIEVSSGTTLSISQNITITGSVSGNGQVNATSMLTYNITEDSNILKGSYDNLKVFGSGTKTLTGAIITSQALEIGSSAVLDTSANNYSITVTGDITNSGTITANGSSITLSEDFINIGTFNAGSSTVTFNSGSAQSLTGGSINFNGLVLTEGTVFTNLEENDIIISGESSGTGTVNAGDGTFTYNSSGVQTLFGGNYSDLTVSGGSTKTLTGNINLSGNLSIAASTTLDTSAGNYSINIAGNISNSGTLTVNSSTVYFDGGGIQNITGGNVTFYGLDLAENTVLTTSQNITVSNAASGTGTVNASGGTFTYSFGGAQTVYEGSYNALTISGGETKSLAGAVNLGGTLTIGSDTTLDTTTDNYSINIAGNISNSGTFTVNSSTVYFDGGGIQNITGGNVTFYGLDLAENTVLTTSQNITVSNATSGTGTVNASGGTFTYNLEGAQTVYEGTYNALTLSGSGIKSFSGTTTATGGITVSGSLTVDGDGNTTTFIQAADSVESSTNRVFNIEAGNTVTISDITIRYGASDFGGGICINSTAVLTLTSCIVCNNDVTNAGGGIYINTGASLAMTNCTVRDNTAGVTGGIYVHESTLNMYGTNTFARNTDLNAELEDALYSNDGTVNLNNSNMNTDEYESIGISENSVFSSGTSTVIYNGDAQKISSVTYYNLTVSNGNTKTFANSADINGNLTINSETTLSHPAALYLAGDLINNGTFNVSEVFLDGGCVQNITGGSVTFSNLSLSAGTILTTSQDITITSLTTGTGTVNASNGTFTYSFTGSGGGEWGVFAGNYNNLSISGTEHKVLIGNIDIAGNFTIESSTILSISTYSVNLAGDLSNSGTFYANSGTFYFDGGTVQNITDGSVTFGTLNLAENTVLTTSQDITVSNAVSGTGTVNASGGTFTYGGSTDQTVYSGNYNSLTLSVSGTKTLAGTVDLAGSLTIGTETTLDASGESIYLAGDLSNSGTFTANSNTVYFDGGGIQNITGGSVTFHDLDLAENTVLTTSQSISVTGSTSGDGTVNVSGGTFTYSLQEAQTVFGGNYNILTLSGSSTKTLAGAVNLADGLTIGTGTTLDTSGESIYLAGDLSNSGTFTANSNTVYFDGGGIQNVTGGNVTFYGLDLAENTVLTTSQSISVTGSTSGDGTVNVSDGTFTYSGDSAQTVYTGNYNALTLSGSSTKTLSGETDIDGNLTVGSGTVFSMSSGSYSVNLAGDISNSGTFAASGGTVYLDGGGIQNITDGSVTFSGLDLAAGTVLTTINNITITGSTSGTGTVNATEGTITYSASSGQAIFAGTYNSLVLTDGSLTLLGSSSKTLTGNLDIIENLNINSGAVFDTSINNYYVNVDGNLNNSGTFTANSSLIYLAGDFTNSGTFSANGSTVYFDGGVIQNITGGSVTFYSLDLAEDTVLTTSQSISVTGTASGDGTVNASDGTFTYSLGGAQAVYAGNYNSLTLSESGTKTLAGEVDLAGSLTIGSGTTLDASAQSIYVAGDFTNSGGFTANSGTVYFDGATVQNITGGTVIFSGIDLASGTVLTTSQNITVTGEASGAGTVNASGATFTYSLEGAQTVYGGTYNLLTLSGSGTKTLAGNSDINGDFTIGSEVDFAVTGSYTVTLAGNLISTGTLTASSGTFYLDRAGAQTISGGGAVSFYGLNIGFGTALTTSQDITVTGEVSGAAAGGGTVNATGGTFTYSGEYDQNIFTGSYSSLTLSGSGTKSLTGDLEASGVLTYSGTGGGSFVTNAWDISAGGLTVTSGTFNSENSIGTWDINGNVLLSGGTVNSTKGLFEVSGDWSKSGEFVHNSGTVVFDDASSDSHISGENTFYNFTCSAEGKSLYFSGDLQTVAENGWFTIRGTHTGTGPQWVTVDGLVSNISDSANYRVTFAWVSNSDNSAGGQDLIGSFSHDGGNNTNWEFENYYIWDGSDNSDWDDTENWNLSSGETITGGPGEDDDVLINTQVDGFNLVVEANRTVEDFFITGGRTVQLDNNSVLNLTESFENEGALISLDGNGITVTADSEAGSIYNSGDISSDGELSLGAHSINLGENIYTTNDNLTLTGTLFLDEDTVISTGSGSAGDITLEGSIDGHYSVQFISGGANININTASGSTTRIYEIILQDDSATGSVTFNGAVRVGTVTSYESDYSVTFTGNTDFYDSVSFLNTDGVYLGNSADDIITFNEGVTNTASTTYVYGTVTAPYENVIELGDVIVTGTSEIGCTIELGDVEIASGETLTLGDGSTSSVSVSSINSSGGGENSVLYFDSEGTISVTGNIGDTGSDIEMTLLNSESSTFSGTVNLQSLTVSEGSGSVEFEGAVTTDTLRIDNGSGDSTTFSSNLTVNVMQSSGSIVFADGDKTVNTISLLDDTDIILSGGTLSAETFSGNYNLVFETASGGSATGVTVTGNIENFGSGTGAALTLNSLGTFVFEGTVGLNSGITGSSDSDITFEKNVTLADGDTGTNLAGNVTFDGTVFSGYDGITFGTTVFSSAGAAVTSHNSNITFGQVTASSTALTLNAGSGNVTASDSGNVMGDLTVTGNNVSIAENDAITQSGAWDVNGAMTLSAGTNNILLDNTQNDFTGAITATGANITLYDVNSMVLGNITSSGTLTLSAAGNVTQSSGTVLSADTVSLLGSGSYTLSNSGNIATEINASLSGGLSYSGTVGSLGTISTGGTLALNTDSTVSQTAAVTSGGLDLSGGGTYNFDAYSTTVSGDLSVGSSASFDIGSQTLAVGGDFINGGTFSSTGSVLLNGTTRQEIDGNGSSGAFSTLVLNNAAGAVLSGNTDINGELTLSSGLFLLSAYRLTLGADAVIGGTPSSSNMIVTDSTGMVRKYFNGNGSFIFPIGTDSGTPGYSPMTVEFVSGMVSGSYAEVRVAAEKSPYNQSTSNYLNRSWVIESDISDFDADMTVQYLPSDVTGNESLIYFGEYVNGSWVTYGAADTINHTLTATGMTSFCTITGISDQSNPNPTRPDINNGMMINDGTEFCTATSWKNAVDEEWTVTGPDETASLFDTSVYGIADGEYSMRPGISLLGGEQTDGIYGYSLVDPDQASNGKFTIQGFGKFIGAPADAVQEFNSQYDGIIDISLDLDASDTLIDFESIAAYNEKHPLFKTDLDLILEKI